MGRDMGEVMGADDRADGGACPARPPQRVPYAAILQGIAAVAWLGWIVRVRIGEMVQMPKRADGSSPSLSGRKRWVTAGIGLALAAIAGVAVGIVVTRPRQPDVGTAVGYTAPEFVLQSLDGDPVALSALRGKVVLLVFWQSNCPDCNRAMPAVRALWKQYRERGVVLLGVNLDHELEAALRYLDEEGYADQITLRESYDAAMAVVRLYDVPFVPYTVLVDRRGLIRFAGVYPALPAAADVERWL